MLWEEFPELLPKCACTDTVAGAGMSNTSSATSTTLVEQEKGIDVPLVLNVVRLAYQKKFDVALVFSQDEDPFKSRG